MSLQVAIDRMDPEAALDIVRAVARDVDWIEVGTSMIKAYGAAYLTRVVEAAAPTPVLADLKTADDARWEFGMAFDAGARSATVLGLASDTTIDTAAAVAAERGCEAVIDLMGVSAERRAALVERLPAEVVLAAHVGKDGQSAGGSVLDALGPWATGRRLAVAGGLTAPVLARLSDQMSGEDVRAIIGSAVTAAEDPAAAVRDLLTALHPTTRTDSSS